MFGSSGSTKTLALSSECYYFAVLLSSLHLVDSSKRDSSNSEQSGDVDIAMVTNQAVSGPGAGLIKATRQNGPT